MQAAGMPDGLITDEVYEESSRFMKQMHGAVLAPRPVLAGMLFVDAACAYMVFEILTRKLAEEPMVSLHPARIDAALMVFWT